MGELCDKLTEYSKSDVYPFHMPGHKRNMEWLVNPYDFDITEIAGFDDLHSPSGILARINESFESLYGDGKVFLTVNGSTVGILAGVSAVIDSGDTILIGRNCHKSVYNAAFIRKANVEYIYPDNNKELGISLDIKASNVDKCLKKNPHIKAVVITSPTYEGVISDIESIAKVVHKHNAILIVDGAHGAHLGIINGSLITQMGADIVIMSIHKTLPAPTQTALIWVKEDNLLIKEIEKYLHIYETSSPSYILMCGAEKCLDYLKNKSNIDDYNKMINDFRSKAKSLKKLYLFSPECDFDIGKIVIGTSRANISGEELKVLLLEKYQLELEMASENYVLAMSTIADQNKGLDRLLNALIEIDDSLDEVEPAIFDTMEFPVKVMEMHNADRINKQNVILSEAEGKVCGSYIYAYPPGIPWVVPGEMISKEIIEQIIRYKKFGIDVRGINDEGKICTVER